MKVDKKTERKWFKIRSNTQYCFEVSGQESQQLTNMT